MFITCKYPDALSLLGTLEIDSVDTVIPAERRDLGHCPYRPEYAWLFFYERTLARRLDPWLKPYRPQLFGGTGLISEMLSNAFCHGHQREASWPIEVHLAASPKGILLSVLDQGPGFDVQASLQRLKDGKQHAFHNAGNGLRTMAKLPDFWIFFDETGAQANLLYLREGPRPIWEMIGRQRREGGAR